MIRMTGDLHEKRTRMTGLTGITTIMDKSPWDHNAIFIFFLSFLGSLIKRCIPFEIFLQFSLSPLPTLYKVEMLKTFCISNFVCGVRGGVGPV